jgi:peptide deformylase
MNYLKYYKPIAEALIKFMQEHNGVGAAAPQIGINEKIFVIYPDIVCIEPEIIAHSTKKIISEEGCLTQSSKRHNRYKWIKVRFKNLAGTIIEATLKNNIAIIYQHELDHIQ